MEEIRLNGHHIKFVEAIRKWRAGKFDFEKIYMIKVYGAEFTNRVYKWAKNLDEDTLVAVDAGYASSPTSYSPDSICKQSCPYSNECSDNPYKIYFRMFKKAPQFFPWLLIAIYLANDDEKELKKRRLKAGQKYRLGDIIR